MPKQVNNAYVIPQIAKQVEIAEIRYPKSILNVAKRAKKRQKRYPDQQNLRN